MKKIIEAKTQVIPGKNKIFMPGQTVVGDWGNPMSWAEVASLSGSELQRTITEVKGVKWRDNTESEFFSLGCYLDWRGKVMGQSIPSWEYNYFYLIEDLCSLYRVTIQQEHEWLWLAEVNEKPEEVTGKEHGRLIWAGAEGRFPGVAVCYLYLLSFGRIDEKVKP